MGPPAARILSGRKSVRLSGTRQNRISLPGTLLSLRRTRSISTTSPPVRFVGVGEMVRLYCS